MVEEGAVYLGLGSNLGRRARALARALQLLREGGVTQEALSSVYLTSPVGHGFSGPFYNAVVQVSSPLAPEELLPLLLGVEREMGRPGSGKRPGDRVIDIDLLLHGCRRVESPALTLPHPRMRERLFVLLPLAELSPRTVLPGGEEDVSCLARSLAEKDPRQQVLRVGCLEELLEGEA